jgi:competence protein ComEA
MTRFAELLLLAAALPLIAFAEPVNINTADAATLDRELKGIGPARAQAIIAYRTAHGPFRNIDELTLVEGIGQKVVDQNRQVLSVGTPGKATNKPGAKGSAPPAAAPAKPAKTVAPSN